MTPRLFAASLMTALLSCAPPPGPVSTRNVATVGELMTSIIDPAADDVWNSVAVIEDVTGTEVRAPSTDADWTRVRGHALTVSESGNLLLLPGRADQRGEWTQLAKALTAAGADAADAAGKHDANGLIDAGERLYAACAGCHQRYMTRAPSQPGKDVPR